MIAAWQPARCHPETYPGDCPRGSFVIIDQRIHDVVFAEAGQLGSAQAVIEGRRVPLDRILAERDLRPLADRYPSLAYGANRNPATLAIKMDNYKYEGHGGGLVLPVLKGSTAGRDVVACGLSGQGYLYADLMIADDDAHAIEAWFPLLDHDQLRVMHDGERVREGMYSVAEFPARMDGFARPLAALGYAADEPVFVSPEFETPIAYTAIGISRRSLPAMTAAEMIDHVVAIGGLWPRVAELTCCVERPRTVDVMQFMNERWWIRYRGDDQPDRRYDELLAELNAVLDRNRGPRSTAWEMRRRGLTLAAEHSYDPGDARTVGAMLEA